MYEQSSIQKMVAEFFCDDQKAAEEIKKHLEKGKYDLPPQHITTRLVDRNPPWTEKSFHAQMQEVARKARQYRIQHRRL